MIDEVDELEWDANLKPKERIFVLHYCADEDSFLNATRSYQKAYQKKDKRTGAVLKELDVKTCEACGSRMYNRERVKLAIRRLLKITQEEHDETNTYRLLADVASLATFNPADVIDDKGNLKCTLEELGEKAKLISQIEPTKFGVKVTLADRSKYIDLFMKYLNIVRPETQLEIKLPIVEVAPKIASVDEWNKEQEDK
jgi:hypothetical protein